MLVFDPEEARKTYQDECTERYHGSNYESYKQRRTELGKYEEKIFRRDGCLYGDFKEYYDYINYEHEIDRLRFYGYKEYVKDFIFRREDSIDENDEDEDDDW